MNQTANLSPRWTAKKMPRSLTRAIALEEPKTAHFLLFVTMLIGIMLGAFIAWASLAQVEEIASASGTVIPSGYIQSVQHLDGGIVRQILVEEGQMVEEGQPLLKLDQTNANADLGQMSARRTALKSQIERLQHFVSGKAVRSSDLPAEERAILSSMEDARRTQQNVLQTQIAQKQEELNGLKETQKTLEQNIALMQKETNMQDSMAAKGYGSQLTALSTQRELNQMQGQLQEAISGQAQARAAISEAQSRVQSLNADLKQDAMKRIGDAQAELAETQNMLNKAEGAASRTTIIAPVRGIVKGMTIHSLGAVVEPGKVLMEIVPVQQNLMVEAMVLPSDIGNIKKNDAVKVKVSAFDFSRYGKIQGHVDAISASTFQNEKGESFYKVKVALDRNYVGMDETRNLILPGMTVQADIVTGNKTILQYLLKPMNMLVADAFHER